MRTGLKFFHLHTKPSQERNGEKGRERVKRLADQVRKMMTNLGKGMEGPIASSQMISDLLLKLVCTLANPPFLRLL